MQSPDRLSPALVERILAKLGFGRAPEPTPEGLSALYAAWCQRVPFDNVRKLIHVRSGDPGPLPASTPEDFFAGWLAYGTGGTCWAGAGACTALLRTLGFDAVRGMGTMLAAPDLPPNHGTVLVRFGAERVLVDCSILHGAPLPIEESKATEVAHPAWGVRCAPRDDGRLRIEWRALHKLDGFECRLERFGLEHAEFFERHEATRGWSPFNYETSARLNRGDCVVGLGFGKVARIETDGSAHSQPASKEERNRVLIEELGLSEEIVSALPADIPTPPPPGSLTAQRAGAGEM